MTKEEIYKYLDDRKIKYEKKEHMAVYSMDDIYSVELPHPEAEAKNLFVRDDKKEKYYLITVKGSKKVNLKEFSNKYNTRRLSFASEEDLYKYMNLKPGSVTPLGLLNDLDNKVVYFIDKEFNRDMELIGVHPNDNTATIWLNVKDLIMILRDNKTVVNFFDI